MAVPRPAPPSITITTIAMESLPVETLSHIFAYVGSSAEAFLQTCSHFRRVSNDTSAKADHLLVRYGRPHAVEAAITTHVRVLTPALLDHLFSKGATIQRQLAQRLVRDGLLLPLSGLTISILYAKARELYGDWKNDDSDAAELSELRLSRGTARIFRRLHVSPAVVKQVETFIERSNYCLNPAADGFASDLYRLLNRFPNVILTYAKIGMDINILPDIPRFFVDFLHSDHFFGDFIIQRPVELLALLLRHNLLVLSERQFADIVRLLNDSRETIAALRAIFPLLPFKASAIAFRILVSDLQKDDARGMDLSTARWLHDIHPEPEALEMVGNIVHQTLTIPDTDLETSPAYVQSFSTPLYPSTCEWILENERNLTGAASICLDHLVITMARAEDEAILTQSMTLFERYVDAGVPMTRRHVAWFSYARSDDAIVAFVKAVERTGGKDIIMDVEDEVGGGSASSNGMPIISADAIHFQLVNPAHNALRHILCTIQKERAIAIAQQNHCARLVSPLPPTRFEDVIEDRLQYLTEDEMKQEVDKLRVVEERVT
ncbi:hypothetical protein BC938DRAFT_472940 [Jimgerdemannia flammicorona]|uniref:F-box domain-containing protein n=1 Tax=Jimgerdemannia flammicorona TaxID=994334 RepID=A0A433Q534_9FUNG|nr:hypothetical protein BC938DRAFT_472940 [Jimgerdemannia flammicorona]